MPETTAPGPDQSGHAIPVDDGPPAWAVKATPPDPLTPDERGAVERVRTAPVYGPTIVCELRTVTVLEGDRDVLLATVARLEKRLAEVEKQRDDRQEAYETMRRIKDTTAEELAEVRSQLASARAAGPVPEDDGEPWTDDWLESIGFRENTTDEGHVINNGRISLCLFGNYDVAIEDCDNSVWIGNEYTTRGHIRHLLAALGISLSPPEAGRGPDA